MAGAKADVDAETGDGGSFSEQRLIDKLKRLNNSAASIQTLSRWCIFHRKKAKRVVDTWEKQFTSAREDKKISFLYLSNDILQNSKRKGADYVDEFWRVLPRSLKHVYEKGGGEGKNQVARLISIWDDRKVFGTRIESMKNGILGDNPPILDNNGNSLNPSSNPTSNSKAARKDSGTIVKKLTVGGMPEKIVSAYQLVLDQHFDEDTALNKCKTTLGLLERINKDINDSIINGNQPALSLISDLQEQEMTLKHCIKQLESVDMARISLVNQLKEALNEQESKSLVLRDQLQGRGNGSPGLPLLMEAPVRTRSTQHLRACVSHAVNSQESRTISVAQTEAQRVIQLRKQLGGALVTSVTHSTSSPLMITPPEQTSAIMQGSEVRSTHPQSQPLNPAASLPPTVSAVGDESKRTAAAMADKLASLSAPVQVQQQIGGTHPPAPAPGSFPPPPPPLPSLLPPLLQQFGQNTGGMIGMGGPFGMMAGSMPPPPPLSNILPAGFPRPSGPPPPPPLPPAQSQPQQQSPQAAQQSPTSTGFFQSSGMGFFPPAQVQQSPSAQRQ
uniref:CID domain-containing protein n=1 Tax=Zea mays TaxID=4577 RepID=A0A804NYK4_MAIZE